ncbi:helicase domain-containing protein [Planoprotostelium fungivorum]|uniref:Helicase domain-containing protein n=1 Tax=Planoprotostelium fungivorum TaxID=1890364 RepID=A0A2P6NAA6_9EUKA|nr:helicase domain-containing protein [Planoprotostelium fungivorum]
MHEMRHSISTKKNGTAFSEVHSDNRNNQNNMPQTLHHLTSQRDGFYMTGMSASKISSYLLADDLHWRDESYDDAGEWEEELRDYFIEEGRTPIVFDLFESSQPLSLHNSTTSLAGGSTIPSISNTENLKRSMDALCRSFGQYEEDEDDVIIIAKYAQSRCFICLEDLVDCQDLITIKGCSHVFCQECLSSYIAFKSRDVACIYHRVTLLNREAEKTIRIENVNAYGIPCAAMGCTHVMLINELVPVADMDTIQRFIDMSKIHRANEAVIAENRANAAPEPAQDRHCLDCRSTDLRVLRSGRLACLACRAVMCSDCLQRHPKWRACTVPASIGEEEIHLVRCPSCRMPVQKNGGCDHMHCRCGAHFCWLCGREQDPGSVYRHVNTCNGKNMRKTSRVDMRKMK